MSNKSDREVNPPAIFDNTAVSEVNHHTYLGITVSFNLWWNTHVDELCAKANKRLNMMLPLKYKLDRRSLENMYKSFVRPVMEYGIVVWGGTYHTSLSELEEINIKAMRIITGATEKSNIAKLSLETSISSVAERRDMAMLLMFYKVGNNLVPDYLSQLLPSANRNIVKYNLRNNDEIKLPFMRLETFRRSFILYALKLWNLLSIQYRTISCVYEFKTSLSEIFNTDSKILYYYGQRWANVHHSRMRIGCSGLNYDLHTNLHVINSPSCRCGAPQETANHYFMECILYDDQRLELRDVVSAICPFEFKALMHGNEDLSYKDNCRIFDAVHKYLEVTKRFC